MPYNFRSLRGKRMGSLLEGVNRVHINIFILLLNILQFWSGKESVIGLAKILCMAGYCDLGNFRANFVWIIRDSHVCVCVCVFELRGCPNVKTVKMR